MWCKGVTLRGVLKEKEWIQKMLSRDEGDFEMGTIEQGFTEASAPSLEIGCLQRYSW